MRIFHQYIYIWFYSIITIVIELFKLTKWKKFITVRKIDSKVTR